MHYASGNMSERVECPSQRARIDTDAVACEEREIAQIKEWSGHSRERENMDLKHGNKKRRQQWPGLADIWRVRGCTCTQLER